MGKHTQKDIQALVAKLTLREKCSLLSGSDFWHTKAIERLGIPRIMVSDGPHGLRKQSEISVNANESIQAVCFPAACASASSFSKEILSLLGKTLAKECRAEGVSTILGPAINIKRSPLCGRNFEYMSEDPYLAGELASAYIQAVQEGGVGTSLKHFALNNQEYRRLTNSSDCDERTMREIYLAAFEKAVKTAQPKTIMHSYNLINGTYSGESSWLLTDVLRKEWGFEGLVMSDWGAVNDRVKGLAAGSDLEMPFSGGETDRAIEAAAQKDTALCEYIDKSCARILKWVYDFVESEAEACFDIAEHHKIAQKIAEESIVLLKNKGNVLPLKSGISVAVIGEFAIKPRIQGGGSSHINTKTVTQTLSCLSKQCENLGIRLSYAKGFSAEPKDAGADYEASLLALKDEALQKAQDADVVLIFAGLPDSFESEGYDRSHIHLPSEQDELIKSLSALGKKTVVVLHNGSPVDMPWAYSVDAIVEAYLCGEAVGEAITNILLGIVNPSGKLSETFPLRLEDTPSFLDFANNKTHTRYAEGLFVGYRWYDARNMDVLFPFGHGLSYTTFAYEDAVVSKTCFTDAEKIQVSLSVRNTGELDGKEVVQLYVSDRTNSAVRPKKELKGFEKVFIRAGGTATVTFTLDKRSFAWYSVEKKDWYASSGEYDILIGSSSRDIRKIITVRLKATELLPVSLSLNTTVGDMLSDPRTKGIMKQALDEVSAKKDAADEAAREAISEEMEVQMQDSNPLRNLPAWNMIKGERFTKLMSDLSKALE